MNFFTFIIQSEIPANCQNIKLQAANIKTANKERSDTSFSCIINYFSFATIWPDLTCSPSLTNILSTVPLIGARIFVSIFIASMTAIGCFACYCFSPSFTSTLMNISRNIGAYFNGLARQDPRILQYGIARSLQLSSCILNLYASSVAVYFKDRFSAYLRCRPALTSMNLITITIRPSSSLTSQVSPSCESVEKDIRTHISEAAVILAQALTIILKYLRIESVVIELRASVAVKLQLLLEHSTCE